MIVSVTLNPCVDRVLFVNDLKVGDTNRVLRTEIDAGGKGVNLSRVVAELGGKTTATGFVGGGPGAYIKHVLDKQRVENDFVELMCDTRINFSVEVAGDGPPTTSNESGTAVCESEWTLLLAKVAELSTKASWLALGGSIPPGLPSSAFASLIEIGHQAGCKVLLDADGEAMKLGVAARPDLIKPNSKEASRLLGKPVNTDSEAIQAISDLQNLGVATVILSRGKDGAVLGEGNKRFIGQSPDVKVVSTIGSGDSLLAGYLWAIESGKPADEALRWGLACGAATAATDGSEIARKPVILRLLETTVVREYRD